MKTSPCLTARRALAALTVGLAASVAPAQTASTADTPAPADDKVVVLDTFQVTTTRDRGYLAGNSVSATRIDTPIKDLPFSISAFTEQFIEDIGALELLDVVNFAPGVTSGAKEFTQGNNRYSIRGFDGDVTPQRNGFVGNRYVDSGNIARVEVVKGPASLLYGQITPGGTVNYITKRATDRNFVKIKTQVGTDDFFRTDLDVNRTFADGKVSARFIGAYENLLAWADPSGGDAHLLAGSIVIKPVDAVSLTIDLESYTKNQTPLIGMKPNLQVAGFNSATAANYPVLTDRARAQAYIDAGNLNLGFLGFAPLPADFNYPSNNDYRISWFDSANAELNVRLGDNWRARANVGWSKFRISNKLTGLAEFTVTPAAGYLATAGKNRFTFRDELAADPRAVLTDPSKTASALLTRRKRLEQSMGDSRAYQAEVTGLIEAGSVKFRPLFGAYLNKIGSGSFRRETATTPPSTTPNSATTGLQHFQPWNYNDPSTWDRTSDYDLALIPNINSFNDAEGEESAYYALLNTSLLEDRLILVGGARYNKTWTVNTNYLRTVVPPLGDPVVGDKFEASETTPQFGAGFKVRRDLLLFASYSESFFIEDRSLTAWNPAYNPALPTSSTNAVTVTTPAKPTTGSGYEFGLKTDFLEGRVSSTLSWFHLERKDRVLRFRQTAPDGSFPTLTSQGTVDQSEGFEFEVTWSPRNNWQIFATLSLMDIKTIKAEFAANPVYSGSTDAAAQAAYLAAYNEAKGLILNAVPEGSAETLATLWTRYTFTDGPLKNVWLGGGFVHTGDKAQRTANPTLFLEADTIFDATIGYDWKAAGASWSATLAWKNIADTEYFNANQSRGNPGRVMLSLSSKF
ncbi:TonB-dependent siderophore receptor [Oleiharenicola lentus]|nr:TonB-dependent receptor [Oleiharenicola lentus]